MVILLAVVITLVAQTILGRFGETPIPDCRRRGGRPTIWLAPGLASDTDALQLCRSGCRVPAFGKFFDHLPVKRWDVVGFSAGNQSIVHNYFLIHPARARVAHIDLDRRPRCHFPAANKIRTYQNLWAMTDGCHRFVFPERVLREFKCILIHAKRIRIE
jgi:pimeloyl-ACP methyl ester carboxylesterase